MGHCHLWRDESWWTVKRRGKSAKKFLDLLILPFCHDVCSLSSSLFMCVLCVCVCAIILIQLTWLFKCSQSIDLLILDEVLLNTSGHISYLCLSCIPLCYMSTLHLFNCKCTTWFNSKLRKDDVFTETMNIKWFIKLKWTCCNLLVHTAD